MLDFAAMGRVHVVTFRKDGAARTVTLRRSVIVLAAALKLALVGWAAFSLYLLVFRDTLVSGLIADQARMRVEYEAKLAGERAKLDDAESRQASAQGTFENRLRELLFREAELQTRTETVAELLRSSADPARNRRHLWLLYPATNSSADRTKGNSPDARSVAPLNAINDIARQRPHPIDDTNVSTFTDEHAGEVLSDMKGHSPVAIGPALGGQGAGSVGPRTELFDGLPRRNALGLSGPVSIETVVNSLDSVERLQVETLEHANSRAAVAVDQLRGALRRSGLDPARFAHLPKRQSSDTGGPFLPLPKDGIASRFDALLHGLKVRLEEHDTLSRTITMLPLRQPLAGQLEITSSYGARKDPFGMGWALHPGIDLRAEEGTTVRATASGKVVTAGFAGGYGNMVEIDHGEGISTRYGHLSAILISDGQFVAAGTPIGRVGSTGRSTGPHLHYETRVDGEPVDPLRFLNSSDMLVAANGGVD
jgi:murein DD-endopeptidase MepM/ murein hydrolase activator NlpD